jgi:hypothetical protein
LELLKLADPQLMAMRGFIQELLKKGENEQAKKLKNRAIQVASRAFETAKNINGLDYQRDIQFQLAQIYSQFPEDNEIGIRTAEEAYEISFDIVYDQLSRQSIKINDYEKMKQVLEYLVQYLEKVVKDGKTPTIQKDILDTYKRIQRNHQESK